LPPRAAWFAEVGLGRDGEAVGALAEVDLVDVQLENLVLRQTAFDLECEKYLVELAVEGLLARQEKVARHLHRDRRCSLAATTGRQIGERRARDADRVDPGVFVEAFVLGGEDGLLEDRRDVCDADHATTLLAEFAQQVAVGRIDAQGYARTVIRERLEGRQIGPGEE
jgi:hypothetical protein